MHELFDKDRFELIRGGCGNGVVSSTMLREKLSACSPDWDWWKRFSGFNRYPIGALLQITATPTKYQRRNPEKINWGDEDRANPYLTTLMVEQVPEVLRNYTRPLHFAPSGGRWVCRVLTENGRGLRVFSYHSHDLKCEVVTDVDEHQMIEAALATWTHFVEDKRPEAVAAVERAKWFLTRVAARFAVHTARRARTRFECAVAVSVCGAYTDDAGRVLVHHEGPSGDRFIFAEIAVEALRETKARRLDDFGGGFFTRDDRVEVIASPDVLEGRAPLPKRVIKWNEGSVVPHQGLLHPEGVRHSDDLTDLVLILREEDIPREVRNSDAMRLLAA